MKKIMFVFVLLTGFIMQVSIESCMAQQVTYAKGITLVITMRDGSQVSGTFISQDNLALL